MSISPFHGGLVFQDDIEKQYLVQKQEESISQEKSAFDLNQRDINEFFNPRPSTLSLEERYRLVASVGEEIIQPEELMALLKSKSMFRCYDGFEPSGRMHIAQGIMKAINVNKIAKAGGIFVFWVADWFALLNNKMDGDLEKIKVVGRYFIEVWKAAGMNLSNVQFLWASDEIRDNSVEYWQRVIDISRKSTISRIKKCATIMGRQEGDELPAAQIMYPCMQCSDIFHLKADICQLGMDQRKVNMLARDYCDAIGKKDKPIILSHHMMMGMKEGQAKMSKSDPDSAIFMEDSAEDVKRKIMKKAYCPPGVVEDNPVLDYTKHILFESFGHLTIKRSPENGGDVTFQSYAELEEAYKQQKIHPLDLKHAATEGINILLQPVRDHFNKDPYAKRLLEQIKAWQEQMKKKSEQQHQH